MKNASTNVTKMDLLQQSESEQTFYTAQSRVSSEDSFYSFSINMLEMGDSVLSLRQNNRSRRFSSEQTSISENTFYSFSAVNLEEVGVDDGLWRNYNLIRRPSHESRRSSSNSTLASRTVLEQNLADISEETEVELELEARERSNMEYTELSQDGTKRDAWTDTNLDAVRPLDTVDRHAQNLFQTDSSDSSNVSVSLKRLEEMESELPHRTPAGKSASSATVSLSNAKEHQLASVSKSFPTDSSVSVSSPTQLMSDMEQEVRRTIYSPATDDEEEHEPDTDVAQRTKKYTKVRPIKTDSESETSVKQPTKTLSFVIPSPREASSSTSLLSSDPAGRKSFDKLQTNLEMGNAFVYMVVPPDGGFGWFILVISFLCQVIVDGLIFAIGIMMPYIAADFGVTPAEVVLVVSTQVGFYFLAGPISSAMINKFGFRPVVLLGSVLSVFSILMASFSTNLPMLIVFYSLMGGPSLSMIWVSSQLIIGYYFERLRPIANGLSVSGAGAGILFGAALNSTMAPKIGWRHTLRIHMALLATIFLMGMSYIEVTPVRVGTIYEAELETDSAENEQIQLQQQYSHVVSMAVSEISLADKGLNKMLKEYEKSQGPGWCKTAFFSCCPALAMWIEARRQSRKSDMVTKRYIIHTDLIERQNLYYTGPAEYDHHKHKTSNTSFEHDQEPHMHAVSFTRSMGRTAQGPINAPRSSMESGQSKPRSCWTYLSPLYWCPTKMVKAFQLLFDFRLLKIAEFQLLLASAFFFPMGFNIPFVYSTVRADIPRDYRILISPTIGFSNFCLRIISGFLAYKYKEYTTLLCGWGIITGGTIVFISAFYGENIIWFQILYAAVYGIAPAFFSTLRAIIYVRALGLEKLTNAFGLTGLSMGLGVFIGTTLAGNFNEYTGSFSASFAFAGTCMILAGSLKVLLPSFMRWRERKSARKVHSPRKLRTANMR